MKKIIIALMLLLSGCADPVPDLDPVKHGNEMFSTGFALGVDCALGAAFKNPNGSVEELRQEARRTYNEIHIAKGYKYLPRM